MDEKSLQPEALTIGRLAWRADVPVDTVRFYERSGLLKPVERTGSGYRLYSVNSLARVQFIRRARELGYNLDQIRQILKLHDEGGSKDEVQTFAAFMIADVEEKIRGLSKWRQLLTDLSDYFNYDGAKEIDSGTVDKLMRGQCDSAAVPNMEDKASLCSRHIFDDKKN